MRNCCYHADSGNSDTEKIKISSDSLFEARKGKNPTVEVFHFTGHNFCSKRGSLTFFLCHLGLGKPMVSHILLISLLREGLSFSSNLYSCPYSTD